MGHEKPESHEKPEKAKECVTESKSNSLAMYQLTLVNLHLTFDCCLILLGTISVFTHHLASSDT